MSAENRQHSFGLLHGRSLRRFAQGAAAASLAMLAVTIPAGAAHADAKILATWNDAKGRSVILRDGTYDGGKDEGFGMTKIREKHKIYNTNSVRFIIKAPDGGTVRGSKIEYYAYANKKTCNDVSHTCTYTESQKVTAVNQTARVGTYYGVPVNATLGILTAYCTNDDRSFDCPWWVDVALNNPAGASKLDSTSDTSQSDGTTTSVDWSYSPLAK